MTSPEQGEFIKRLGGVPVTLGAPEVPSALDRGVVDGVLTASSGGGNIWKDLLKFNYRLGINYFNSVVIVNKERFGKLQPEVQAKVRKIVEANMPLITKAMEDEEESLTKKFAEGGMTVTDRAACRRRGRHESDLCLLGRMGQVQGARRGRGAEESPRRARQVSGMVRPIEIKEVARGRRRPPHRDRVVGPEPDREHGPSRCARCSWWR